MASLNEIIDAASSDDVPISSLLRKFLVLARRVGANEIVEWIGLELAGYSTDVTTAPEYRKPGHVNVLATWSGPFQSRSPGPLGPEGLPENVREALFTIWFNQPIAELEINSKNTEQLSIPWTVAQVATIDKMIQRGEIARMEGSRLIAADKIVPPALMAGVVDNVRNRLLSLALDLEKLNPTQSESSHPDIDPAQANKTFVTNIYGGQNNVITGDNVSQHNTTTVIVGNIESLLAALRDSGLAEDQVEELLEAIKSDEAAGSEPGQGPKVCSVLAKLGANAINSVERVAVSAAGSGLGAVAGALLKAYYGLD